MLLDRFTVFDTMAEYDPETGRFETFSRRAEPHRAAGPLCGDFDYLGGKLVLLYRVGDDLFLEIDGRRLLFGEHVVELQWVKGRRLLEVLSSDGRVVAELTYDPPRLDPPLSLDPTPGVEEWHFDFGLFLHLLSHDPSWQLRLYRPQ